MPSSVAVASSSMAAAARRFRPFRELPYPTGLEATLAKEAEQIGCGGKFSDCTLQTRPRATSKSRTWNPKRARGAPAPVYVRFREGKTDMACLAYEASGVYFKASEVKTMADTVASHYSENLQLADVIAQSLRSSGKDLDKLTTTDLATVDEFHIRGRKATLELAAQMNLKADSHVLDIGSGLGGAARAVAETYGCRVTGIDLTQAFCDAARTMSDWVGLGKRVSFKQGDATNLPFADKQFDAAMTIHVAMNIANKDRLYAEARRVTKPGGVFAVYDVLQGEGGDVLYPVPWARDPSISHLATPDQMKSLLVGAGFKVLDVHDSTEESQSFFERMTAQMAKTGSPPVAWRLFLGDDFSTMARNQVRNVTERRIRTVSYICAA